MADNSIPALNTASGGDTFGVLYTRVNSIINALASEIVTANSDANGMLTTGNAFVAGIFGASNVAVSVGLRGGNVQSVANLLVVSNASFGNSTQNVFVGFGTLLVNGVVTINTTGTFTGANVTTNTTTVAVGNTTVNVVINSSSVYTPTGTLMIGTGAPNTTVNSSMFATGNSTVNVQINSTAVIIGGSNAATVANRSAAWINSSTTYTRGKFNFASGNAITITTTDDSADGMINVHVDFTGVTGGGGGTPGGANTQIQFDDSAAFGGDANLTWVKTSGLLTVGNSTVNVQVNSTSFTSLQSQEADVVFTSTGTSAQQVDTWLVASWRSGRYVVSWKDNNANGYQSSQLAMIFDGTNVLTTEWAQLVTNASLGVLTANANSTAVRLFATPVSTNTTIRASRLLIAT